MCVFVSRRRSCWTRFWMCWWQILRLNASYGYHSCTDLLMLKMVRPGFSKCVYLHCTSILECQHFNMQVSHFLNWRCPKSDIQIMLPKQDNLYFRSCQWYIERWWYNSTNWKKSNYNLAKNMSSYVCIEGT